MNRNIIDEKIAPLLELSQSLTGHLRQREVALLACLPFIKEEGEILEIGSFKGKSTIILAKSALIAGMERIFACDPLLLSCETDPEEAKGEDVSKVFHNNLTEHGVNDAVHFYQMRSTELAESWDKPLKVLWIDGDHTYSGAMADITLFSPFLEKGAVVCFHDVLHGFDGPIRAFIEQVLLSESFGECGMCGSIGWGQYLGTSLATSGQWEKKLVLYKKLSRILTLVLKANNGIRTNDHLRRFYRSLVPHGPIRPDEWIKNLRTRI